MSNIRTKEWQVENMRPIAKFVYYTKMAKFWHNGDTFSFVLNWWNPLAWLFALILVPLSILYSGIPDTFKNLYELGIGIDPYWKERKDERKFF